MIFLVIVLHQLDENQWNEVKPENVRMTGAEYKSIWEKLSGM
jgi:hypothetical protein